MKIYTKILASSAIMLGILPFAASAHGKDNNKGDSGRHLGIMKIMENFGKDFGKKVEAIKAHAFSGSVTAVGTNSLTVTGSDSKVYTVNTTDAKIYHAFNKTPIALNDVKVGDKVTVFGSVDAAGTTVTAKWVLVVPANTHPAMTTGKVTAATGNTVTVQNTHTGVVNNVVISTDANTTVTKDGQPATTADVAVGSNVKVQGLWNETLNVLNAIKINIRTMFGSK